MAPPTNIIKINMKTDKPPSKKKSTINSKTEELCLLIYREHSKTLKTLDISMHKSVQNNFWLSKNMNSSYERD